MNGFDLGDFSDGLFFVRQQQAEEEGGGGGGETREHFRLHLTCNELIRTQKTTSPFMGVSLRGLQSDTQKNRVGYHSDK